VIVAVAPLSYSRSQAIISSISGVVILAPPVMSS
jgi:hypothetical protein